MPNVIEDEVTPVLEDLLKDPDHPQIDDYVKLVADLLQTMCLYNDFMKKNFWILLSLFAKKPSIGYEVIGVFVYWMGEKFDDVKELCSKGLQDFIVQLIHHCGTDDPPEYWRTFVVSIVFQLAQHGSFEFSRILAKTLGDLWRSNELDPILFNYQLFRIIEILATYPDPETQQHAIPLKTEVAAEIALIRQEFEALRNGPDGGNQGQLEQREE